MISKERLSDIKSIVEDNLGKEVKFEVERGKKRARKNVGVIEHATNNVFTIRVDKGLISEHCTSFTYTDVLVEHVWVNLTKTGERIMN